MTPQQIAETLGRYPTATLYEAAGKRGNMAPSISWEGPATGRENLRPGDVLATNDPFIGGMGPGSYSPATSDIHQEGIFIPL